MNSVSVIIPLFNKFPYFEACIDALIQQSVPPQEIIVIDDGSTDGSRALAHQQSEKFEQSTIVYRVFEQEHQGVSAALNAGLEVASSTYVTRVDADDLVAQRWLEIMLAQDIAHKPVNIRCIHKQIPSKATMTFVERLTEKYQSKKDDATESEIESGNVLYGHLFRTIDTNLMSACGMLYVREEILQTHTRFFEGLNHTEDLLFNATLFAHNTPSILVNRPLYFYRQVPNSLSKAPSSLFQNIKVLEENLGELDKQPKTAQVAKAHRSDVLHYLSWYYCIALLEEEKNRTKNPSYSERIEQGRDASNLDTVFLRSETEGVLPPLAKRLYGMLKNKQYAQLQLAARTINVARNVRRSFKLHTSK